MVKEDLEEAEEFDENCDRVIADTMDDFSPVFEETPHSKYAAEIANSYITAQTREGHRRCAFFFFLLLYSC